MPSIDVVVRTPISSHPRVRQLEGMFDVPRQEEQVLGWKAELPIEAEPWNVGLIVGPSGCGKTTVARELWPDQMSSVLDWSKPSVIECFDESRSMQEITEICQAVGFNTIPAWMRPHAVLSNGEKFRVDVARRLLEGGDVVVVDEFTSVVDRQVAQVGSHAVQKFVRRHDRQFVAVACHYDIVDWLQPDWIFEPHELAFKRRSVRRRPDLSVSIYRASHSAWNIFAPFHYLTKDLHKAAKCFVLTVDGQPAAFAGMVFRPASSGNRQRIWGCSRLVTLPDYQGLGLAFVLIEKIGAFFRAQGDRVRTYPAHPSLIRSFDKSGAWSMKKKPGLFSTGKQQGRRGEHMAKGGRPCAIFEYAGGAFEDETAARKLVA